MSGWTPPDWENDPSVDPVRRPGKLGGEKKPWEERLATVVVIIAAAWFLFVLLSIGLGRWLIGG